MMHTYTQAELLPRGFMITFLNLNIKRMSVASISEYFLTKQRIRSQSSMSDPGLKPWTNSHNVSRLHEDIIESKVLVSFYVTV